MLFLKRLFTRSLTRKEVIYKSLDPYLQDLIFKYDYFVYDKTHIFSKSEGMTAMTHLPNGTSVIAYSQGILKVGKLKYKCPKNVIQIIAVSNPQIIIITGPNKIQSLVCKECTHVCKSIYDSTCTDFKIHHIDHSTHQQICLCQVSKCMYRFLDRTTIAPSADFRLSFECKTQNAAIKLHQYFPDILSQMVLLPDDKVAFITHEFQLIICDFETLQSETVMTINKSMSVIEMFIKLQLLK